MITYQAIWVAGLSTDDGTANDKDSLAFITNESK